jgi:hypothetical protein
MGRNPLGIAAVLTGALLAQPAISAAQVPLAPIRASGLSVTPVFEGWYRNPDGSYSISFGYFNRNSKEVVEVPIGADNNISPGAGNQGQPTAFHPRRHWGVFAVVVPANFNPKSKVTWTLKNRGQSYAIAGNLDPLWEIDALQGDAADNTPPAIRFGETAPEGRGPGGITAGPVKTALNTPLALTVWARDDARTRGSVAGGRGGAPTVTLAYFKHQGPGDVTFAPATGRVPSAGGTAATSATFSQPGEYILRVRANDGAVASAGHSQCCWTNGFIRVTVTP